MKLYYRGVSYEAASSKVKNIECLAGKYRSVAWNYQQYKLYPVPKQIRSLKYRGVNYSAVLTAS